MGYEASVLSRATRRLEEERRRREETLARRKEEIYAQLPRLREIDRELKGTVYQIIASSLREGRDPAPSIQVIKDHNLSLQAERTHLLLQNGWGADALDELPACPKCNDTGWVGARMCTCLKKLCGEEQIKELSKLLDLGEQSFETFSMDYYSPLAWPGEEISPRENMEFILDVCSSYARRFGKFYFRNLFLTGAPADVHPEAALLQGVGDVLAPLHSAHAPPGQVVLPADVEELVGAAQAVHVKVEQGEPAPLVLVDDGEGGAGHPLRDPQAPGQPPDKGGLSRPQIPGEGDDGPRLQPAGQHLPQSLGLLRAVGHMLQWAPSSPPGLRPAVSD